MTYFSKKRPEMGNGDTVVSMETKSARAVVGASTWVAICSTAAISLTLTAFGQSTIAPKDAFKIEETRLGAMDADLRSPVVSLDGRHFAYVTKRGEKNCVVVDGREAEAKYNGTSDPILSSDGERVAFETSGGMVVVDGRLGTEEIGVGFLPGELVFSPDGSRVAYTAYDRASPKRWSVVVDGKPGPRYDTVNSVAFSPDSRRFVYAAKLGAKWLMVVDGQPSAEYDDETTSDFSPDSKHIAYLAKVGMKWSVVVDGKPRAPEYDGTDNQIVFSPDSKRLAYGAKLGAKSFVVVDGQPGAEYDLTWCCTFSPDSKRVAYRVKLGARWFTVVDGQPGAECDFTGGGVFSPDSKRVAYGAKLGTKWLAVVDGKPSAEYYSIFGIVFSPDSRRVAYQAQTFEGEALVPAPEPPSGVQVGRFTWIDGKWWETVKTQKRAVVVDGHAGPEYDQIADGTPAFSPDGKHVVYGAKLGTKWFAVVDGQTLAGYDYIVKNSLRFQPNGVLEYLAVKEGSLYRVKHMPRP